jgi:pre-mRNA-splicing factor CDC5/CEF1
LRAAGIELPVLLKKKPKGPNYNIEVPFERMVPQIYKTGKDEEPEPNLDVSNITLQGIEGKMRD